MADETKRKPIENIAAAGISKKIERLIGSFYIRYQQQHSKIKENKLPKEPRIIKQTETNYSCCWG